MEQVIEEFRISPQQERLWTWLDRPGGSWCARAVVSLEGDLDREALRSALLRVVDRHEILRTSFRSLAGQDAPVQVVEEADVVWEEAADLAGSDRGAVTAELLRRAAEPQFDPGSGSRLRATLVALSAREHLLALSLPALCADAASLALLVREIAREIGARPGAPAPEPPLQHIDVSDWQHETLATGEGAGFWRGRDLSGHAGWRLPFERSLSAESAEGPPATAASRIPPDQVRAAERLAADCDAPVAAFFLLVWQALLARLTLLPRVTVGTGFDGRGDAELAGALGPLTRALPLSCDLDAGGSLRDLLVQAGRAWREAERWQPSFSWDRLAWDQGREAPGFEAAFSFVTLPETIDAGGLRIGWVAHEAPFERSAVELACALGGSGLTARLLYDPGRFPTAGMERLAALFETLVASALAEPWRPVGELDLMTPGDLAELEAGWGASEPGTPGEAVLHELFAEHAAAAPDAVAVVCGESSLTYAELERRSNQLAHHLRRLGVGPEALVGLCLERSLDLVVGLLGILKAGGAYVPLDPDAPAERIAFAIEDARMAALVTAGPLAGRLPRPDGLPLVRLDTDRHLLARASDGAPDSSAWPDNAAYVIYTSGSTGRPKGVVVPHAQVVRLLTATRAGFDFGPRDVWTLFHSVAFDFSVWEIWGALALGGRLVVVPYWTSRSPDGFHELLSREGVTVLNQTPSAFHQLVLADGERGGSPWPLALRYVVFGGEALEMASLGPWFERHGDARPRLVNMYGITETTVHVTYRPVSRADLGAGSLIGGPIPDLHLHLLDPGGRRVPLFAPGEIHVGGAGLARGYLNHPGLTAERFLPDPFSRRPGSRLYRSGDQARRLPGFDLDYLGRIDEQVKIRGFRIEPGEIRAALLAHPAVRAAAVVPRDSPGGKRLVAYVVASESPGPQDSELRAFLAGRLPDYMIPAAFVPLPALPLNQNGKLDRKALPEPDATRASATDFVPPYGLEEELLAAIWERVLAAGRVGRNDNFFALGGDSIRSILVQSEAREAGLALTVQQLFQHPTLRELAREIRHDANTEPESGRTSPFGLIPEEDRQRLPADVEDAYPLALLQAGMLFHSELDPESAVYHDIFTVHLHGVFDLPAMRSSLAELVASHPMLRTSFDMGSFAEPLQLVHREAEIPLGVTDLRHLDAAEQEAEIGAWTEVEKHRAFNWRQPPLLRVEVHRRGESSFQFSLGFHHAILDGWSLASMLSELFRRYLALAANEAEVDVEPPAATYRDFVAAERRTLHSEESRRYWADVASGSPRTPPPGLSEEPRGDAGLGEVRRVFATIPSDVSDELKRISRQAGVPLKSVLLAAHARAMAYLSGATEVTTGLISNGRLEENGGERVVGLFLNTVPFWLRLAGGSWLALVRRTFAAELALLPHRRFPLAEIQRMAGGQPLIETVFNFIHFHVYEGLRELRGLEVVSRDAFEEANFPFAAVFFLDQTDGPVQLRFDIRADLLERIDVARGVYERTLAALASDPEAHFESAVLLSAAERAQILEAGDGPAGPPPCAGVHDLFAVQAERVPDAAALAFGDQWVTYGALNADANRLAHHLRRLGVGPETLVGLCLRRSPALLAGIFGILRAGGAYVPLDPDYPAARIDLLLGDAGVSVLVSDEEALPSDLPEGTRTVLLDRDGAAISRESGAPPRACTTPEHPVYVIYTSGSTGLPKGVVALHGGLANFSQAVVEEVRLGPGHRMLQFASPSFDASALQIFPTLISGSTLVLHTDPARLTSEEILDLCRRREVTVLDLPGALWRQWVDTMMARNEPLPASIATYMTGGEKLPGEVVRRWSRLVPAAARFLSSYGPTEATVTTTFFGCDGSAAAGIPAAATPLGAPLPNTRLRVLDTYMAPVPAGVPGEILIGGAGLARGYLRRPDLTAERFVPDPSPGAEPGSRLYRTGDLARRRPDGGLEFVGRRDHQLKIRGFRVEPGEIEATLAGHPAVREAVVMKREDLPGLQRLVAYILPETGPAPAAADLRELLGRSLPDHMIPSAFVVLDALPLLPNGKLDRAALPAPEMSERSHRFVSPRDPLEQVLAEIWARVLHVEPVGTSDNFFELGGHSLLAAQVMSRVRDAFGIELPLRELFEAADLADLAARVSGALREGAGLIAPPLVPMVETPREGRPLPLSFAQQRLWLIDQLTPGSSLYNLPVALRVEGPLRADVLAFCLGEIVRRHESLRTAFVSIEGSSAQVIQPAEPFRLTVVDLSTLPEREREVLALALAADEAGRPFDLGSSPLLRGLLVRLAGEDHIAALTMHHIASDGWSMGLLIQEITALYPARAEGRPPSLADLPVQYPDFAVWQSSWLHGATLENEISFWRRQLADLPPHLELPTDRPRPAVQSFRGASRSLRLPAALPLQAQALGRREGATLFMLLLTGFQALLARTSGQQDFAVGSPVAGRNRVETENLIGFFVNMLVLRGDLSGEKAGGPSFRELLGRVRETALAAHMHQDVPFEKLVQELSPERSLARTPLFQVVLALQNAPSGALEIRDLRLRPAGGPVTSAKFDILLGLEEVGGAIGGAIEYATDLFDAATIERLILHYERLLSAALAEPERGIADLPLLPAAERHQLLVEWNDTAVARDEEPAAPRIHEPFEAWARRTPDAVAAAWPGAALTYGALDERANLLAHHLVRLGAGPGSLIGIHLRRGPDLIVAVLAVLKAGAAYVPLEIGHPSARLRWILETLEISCALTETAQQDNLPALPHVLCLDQLDLIGPIRPIRPLGPTSPDDLAYIIFTSGSTGTPKGVMVRHRPVINLLDWAYRTFAFSPDDRVLFVTSLSFDLSVFDIFGLLGAGGSIRIAGEDEIRDPERLLKALAEEPITFWDSAPAALEQTVPFLPSLHLQARPALRLVFLSGDWIPVTLPDRIRDRFTGARVISLGGATEATVWSNVFPLGRVEPSWTSIPYGRPIENARYHVVDSQSGPRLEPCPVGVPGDLYIGGGCLADGYAREPELTAHKFLPDPWSATPGGRLYRTGDRARYLPDGNLEFLGRLDHQVKIRGFRIELGEIETALATLPGVREAAVVVRTGAGPGDRRLVAYVAGDAPAETLRRSLRDRLPDYMVPAAFVTLAALPITANGKVDRKALPAPEHQPANESWVAPRTPAEEVLAQVWADVLGVPRVGIHDNFFELGGDSILTIQIAARVRQQGLHIAPRQLFEQQTVAELAASARSLETGGDTPSDFPDFALSQDQLDSVLAEIDVDFPED